MTLRQILEVSILGAEKRLVQLDEKLAKKSLSTPERAHVRQQHLLCTNELKQWRADLATLDTKEAS